MMTEPETFQKQWEAMAKLHRGETLIHKDGVLVGSFKSENAPEIPEPPKNAGPASWSELHTYTPLGDVQDHKWFNSFCSRVPSCCIRDWAAYVTLHPPDFDPSNWFAWGVQAHNAVSARIGKPILTLEEALTIWRKS